MSVEEAVRDAIGKRDDWRTRSALALAKSIDGTGGASAVKELRALMVEIGSAEVVVSGLDEIKARREKRGA